MKKEFFRICSIFLVIVLLVNMLPMRVFAEEFRESLTAGSEETAETVDLSEAYVVDEIVEKRTEYTKEFLLSNGLHMATVYPDAVHYETEQGWEEIDNTLVAKADGTLTNTAGVWDVSFPQRLREDESITIEKDGYTLSFFMAGELTGGSGAMVMAAGLDETVAAPFAVTDMRQSVAQVQKPDMEQMWESAEYPEMIPEKAQSQITYENVYQNTDIVYDLDSNKVKESVILERYNASLRGYQYTLSVGSMIPVLGEDGQITFYDASGENVVMVMPAPFLVDNAGAHNTDVAVQLTGNGSTYTMTYLLPQKWLAAEDRAWPVVLDPVVEADLAASNIRDRTVAEKKTYEQIWGMNTCGYDAETGIMRFYLKYRDLPVLTSSDVVIGASIHMHKEYTIPTTTITQVNVHKVSGDWDSSTITWANKPGFNTNIEDFAIVDPIQWYSWDVTDIVRGWYAEENTGMMFKASDEIETGGTSNFKQFLSADFGTESSRPLLTITFRNNNGLEGYWDYTSSSAGRAGTGHINNFTGNLVWIRDDIGFDGSRMPVTVTHVYNLNDVVTPSDSNNSNDSGGNGFGIGLGWRTNFNQLVYRWNIDSDYYIWEDSDGTDHYFEPKSANTYVDEDNEELTLTTNGSGTETYCITDKNGNRSYFDSQGRLTKLSNNQETKSHITISYADSSRRISRVTDGVGRVYSFTYNSSNLLTKISYMGNGTTELSYVTFDYTGNKLTCVTDRDGEESTYGYNATGLLTSVQDIDGYTLDYTYNTVVDDWQPYRVQSVSEADGNILGGSLTFAYTHNQTTLTDHEGNVQILQFNDYGNTICIQDDEGRAQYAQFAYNTAEEAKKVKAQDSTAKNNQLRLSSDLQYTVSNLMADNNMREEYRWDSYGETFFWEILGERCAIDTKSLYLHTYEKTAEGRGAYYNQQFSVAPGQTQTFSCYVASGEVGVFLRAQSEDLKVESEPLPISTKWQRAQLTYTNTTATTQHVTYSVLSRGNGGFYIDCPQLEQAVSTASRYNMVNNGDFNQDESDYGWTGSGLSSGDGVISLSASGAPQLDGNVYRITGNPTGKKFVYQTVHTNGKAGDSMTFSGWAKGNSAPLESYDTNDREFAIKAVINYSDGSKSDPFYARFNPDSDQWQYAAGGLVAKKDFWYITLSLVYDYNVNTVYFDGIQVNKDEFGSCYKYDEDGNVVSIVDADSKETTYEYTNNDLTAEILSTGSKLTYTYDGYHNVKTATTEEGLVYTFTYDTYGNNTSVSISGDGRTMSSTATYTSDGNRVEKTTDALGKVTTYSYNAQTNVLEWVQYPGDTDGTSGTVDTRTKYTYDSMYRLVSATGTVDAGDNPGTTLSAGYTYESDLLTAIQTPSTAYSFTYTDFALRSSVKVGDRTLATYKYTEEAVNDRNYDLDALAYGNGDVLEYEYDDQGRVIKQTYEDGETVSYTYGHSGKIATVTSSATGITGAYVYDGLDRLVRYTETGGDHDYLVRYTYNDDNQVRYIYENVTGARDHNAEFTYDDDNRIASYRKGNGIRTYTYDLFDRVSSAVITHKGNEILKTDYTFTAPSDTTTSGQVLSLHNDATDYDVTYSYTYDDNGNILSISDGTNTTSYVYDSANQLLRENNQAGNYTHTWTYDNAGNILNRKEYSYTTGELGEPTDTIIYTYDDSDWGDLLTIYDGNTITYDEIGNPLTDGTWTYTWEHGRQLDSMTDGETIWDYTYGADGLRTKRTDGTTTYDYIYYGGQLMYMYTDNHNFHFTYTPEGAPMGIVYQGTAYYYVTNLQGDVVAILNNQGEMVVSYTYDAWGNILSCTGSMADTLGTYNPLRYRGYVYDNETGLYYVSSRYYDPEIGRFINADVMLDTETVLGFNLFAYCGNNPIMYVDPTGYGRTYVIYYNNPGSGFYDQAMNSPYYNRKSKNVYMISVTSNQDFIDAWNSMSGTIDYVYLYLHGGKGVLYFKGESLSFSGKQSFSSLNSKKVKKGVYLFSCKGGAGSEGNNVAWMFAKLTNSKVYACTGSVSYSKIFGKYYARKAWDWGIIKTFYYQKRYIFWGANIAKSAAGQW